VSWLETSFQACIRVKHNHEVPSPKCPDPFWIANGTVSSDEVRLSHTAVLKVVCICLLISLHPDGNTTAGPNVLDSDSLPLALSVSVTISIPIPFIGTGTAGLEMERFVVSMFNASKMSHTYAIHCNASH
jgi:hypothetical protein